MECSVCDIRSAIGSCSECQALLCEDCGVTCGHCEKQICPEHVHETRSGRSLCLSCYEERRARRRERRAEGASAYESGESSEQEEAAEDEALVLSAKEPVQPWQISLYTALAGLALVLILLAFPGLRRVPLPTGGNFATPYILLFIGAVAIFWAIAGLVGEAYVETRKNCIAGLAIALIVCVLAVYAAQTDPARLAEIEALRLEEERRAMDEEDLKEFREDILDKYGGTSGEREGE
jgi:hypothetical protein